MSAVVEPTEDDIYLLCILEDETGLDLAEFLWIDEENPHGRFRAWDCQWAWYSDMAPLQIDQCGRAVGKSNGIQMRAFAFPFCYPGQEMLITAPELNHLRPLVDGVENRLLTSRLADEMLPKTKGRGINRQPHWQARFANGSRIISRLPNKDGKGVKGSAAAGALVATVDGLVPIEDVRVGDYVLTHAGRFAPVLEVYSYEAETVTITGAGHRGMAVSQNHRVLGRRNRNPQRTRRLDPSQWQIVDSEEIGRWYWASPTAFPELELPDLPCGITDGVELLRLVGRYAADGNLGGGKVKYSHIAFTDSESGVREIEAICLTLGLTTSRRQHDNAVCTVVNKTELAAWLDTHFGHLAAGKKIPGWLFGAPRLARGAFLQGYLAGDGHWSTPKRRWEAGSASKALAIGVKLLAQSLGYNTAYSWVDPKVTEICGVELKKVAQRSHRVQISDHGHGVFEDEMLWGKIRSVEPAGTQMVYDLVVAEDHSYVADGIVHLGSAFLPDGMEA